MRGRIRAQSEIARRGHKPAAEMVQPDAIDKNARSEWIVPAGDGFGQFEASAAFTKGLAVGAAQDLQEFARSFRPFITAVAANKNMRVMRVGPVHQRHG